MTIWYYISCFNINRRLSLSCVCYRPTRYFTPCWLVIIGPQVHYEKQKQKIWAGNTQAYVKPGIENLLTWTGKLLTNVVVHGPMRRLCNVTTPRQKPIVENLKSTSLHQSPWKIVITWRARKAYLVVSMGEFFSLCDGYTGTALPWCCTSL